MDGCITTTDLSDSSVDDALLVKDLLPELHRLRHLLTSYSEDDHDCPREVEDIERLLLQLESVASDYDNLTIVQSIKAQLQAHVISGEQMPLLGRHSDGGCSDGVLSVSSVIQRKGLEPIRKALHQQIVQGLQLVREQDIIDACPRHSSLQSNK